MGTAGSTAVAAARSRRMALRRELATTPGRLRLAAVLIALGAIVFGVVAGHAAGTRQQAVRDVATTEGLLIAAVELSTNLSDAHATAAVSFLAGGPEPAKTRRRYREKLQSAAVGVARLSGAIGTSSRGGPQVERITQKLPVYAGLVDEARANYRRGFPVGGAYLRAASSALRDDRDAMLPSARELYAIEARKLTESYEMASSSWSVLAVVLPALGLLALLVGTQLYLARTTRRIVNPPLLLATVVLLGVLCWTLVAFARQHDALEQAQRSGSDPVELLTAARILVARADAEESITLSARGGGSGIENLAAIDDGFREIVEPIDKLLQQAAGIADRSTDGIVTVYRAYRSAHLDVVGKERIGDYRAATQLAVGPRADRKRYSKQAALALNTVLDDEFDVAQQRFTVARSRAESALGGLSASIPLLTALCAVLALAGVRERLEEYR